MLFPAKAWLTADEKLIVMSKEVPSSKHVRYGWQKWFIPTLYNEKPGSLHHCSTATTSRLKQLVTIISSRDRFGSFPNIMLLAEQPCFMFSKPSWSSSVVAKSWVGYPC